MAVPAGRVPERSIARPERIPRPRPSRPSAPARRTEPRPASHRRPSALRRVLFGALAGLVVGALVLALVTAQALVAQTSFRQQELRARADELSSRNGRLRLEVAELSAPARIARAARRIGLVLPDEVHVIRVPRTP